MGYPTQYLARAYSCQWSPWNLTSKNQQSIRHATRPWIEIKSSGGFAMGIPSSMTRCQGGFSRAISEASALSGWLSRACLDLPRQYSWKRMKSHLGPAGRKSIRLGQGAQCSIDHSESLRPRCAFLELDKVRGLILENSLIAASSTLHSTRTTRGRTLSQESLSQSPHQPPCSAMYPYGVAWLPNLVSSIRRPL